MGFRSLSRALGLVSAVALASTSLAGGSASINTAASESGAGLRTIDISPSSAKLLATNAAGRGLYAVDTFSGKSVAISHRATAGYGAALSPDANLVCYKSIDQAAGTQSPVLYNLASGDITVLATAALAGTPAVSASGIVAFTVGNRLFVQPLGGRSIANFDLGHHVNLISVNANASKVAYNDAADQIVILDVATGARTTVTDGKAHYYAPKFSPDGRHLLVQTITGGVAVTSAKGARVKLLGTGDNPSWLDKNTVSFTTRSVIDGVEVSETAVLAVDISGKVKGVLGSTAGDATAVARGSAMAFAPTGQNTPRGFQPAGLVDDGLAATSSDLQVGLTSDGIAWTEPLSVKLDDSAPDGQGEDAVSASPTANGGDIMTAQSVVNGSTSVYLSDVPYIHQNDDAPDWWNGNWCCNATAALMALQYYNTLPKHPINVSWPEPHVSDYGWYICNTYTFNGHTYNIGSPGPWGNMGYGGYGYITRDNWADTKGYMRDYFINHGASSAVDWSPAWSEALAEVDGNHPFVILTSLTSAGHYPLCIGYVKNQHTLIFNDPYGNKNTGQYPSPDGRMVRYDWPGYNNGYSNLNTVHCFIWCRKNQTAPPPTIVVDNSSSNFSCSSNWGTGTSAADKYGSNYRFRSTAAVSDMATWNFNITQAGSYKIQAWWSQGSNRSAAAPYKMPDNTTVNKNQQTGGGAWQTLGTKTLSTGANSVKLSCWAAAGYVVIADAIRVVPQ